jgi:anti-sigma-K factor RskA
VFGRIRPEDRDEGADMENWVGAVVAAAMVIQVSLLAALFFQTRRTMQKLDKTVTDLNARAGPILTRVQILLDDTQPKISTMVSDAAHIVYLARGQAQKVDRVFTDAADRLRGQLLHVDRILTGTMEAVEDAGTQFRTSFWRPVQKASALVQGIKVGLDLLRSRRRGRNSGNREPSAEQEEELFI